LVVCLALYLPGLTRLLDVLYYETGLANQIEETYYSNDLNQLFEMIYYSTGLYELIENALYSTGIGETLINSPALVVFLGVLLFPAMALFWMRTRFAAKIDVRKRRSEERHRKALKKVQRRHHHKRNQASTRSERRNIDPLVRATRQQIRIRKRDLTPNSLGRIGKTLRALRDSNDIHGVSELYDIVTDTNPEKLGSTVVDYLSKKGV